MGLLVFNAEEVVIASVNFPGSHRLVSKLINGS